MGNNSAISSFTSLSNGSQLWKETVCTFTSRHLFGRVLSPKQANRKSQKLSCPLFEKHSAEGMSGLSVHCHKTGKKQITLQMGMLLTPPMPVTPEKKFLCLASVNPKQDINGVHTHTQTCTITVQVILGNHCSDMLFFWLIHSHSVSNPLPHLLSPTSQRETQHLFYDQGQKCFMSL